MTGPTAQDPVPLVEELARHLRGHSAGLTTEVTTFPSGAVVLDVRGPERMFVLRWTPSHGRFGVDEVGPDDGLGTGDRFGSADFAAARQELLRLLREAGLT